MKQKCQTNAFMNPTNPRKTSRQRVKLGKIYVSTRRTENVVRKLADILSYQFSLKYFSFKVH